MPSDDRCNSAESRNMTEGGRGHGRGAQTDRAIHAATRSRRRSARATPYPTKDALSDHDEPEEIRVAASGPSTQTAGKVFLRPSTMSIYHQCKNKWAFSNSYLASSTIRCCFKRRMTDFWPKMSLIPHDTLDILFADFRDRFTWPEGTDIVEVKRTWKRVAGHIYRDLVTGMKKHNQPHFLSAAIWKKFVEYWKKSEVRKLAELNSKNRHQTVTLHRAGSKSNMQHRGDLRKELGREPTYMEVYIRVHRGQVKDDDGNVTYVWVDKRSSDFFDDYMRMKEKFGDEEMTIEQDDFIFHELNKKRKQVYGFGNQPALPTSSSINVDNLDVARIKQMLEQSEQMIRELQEERKREQAEAAERLTSEQEKIERLRQEQIERDECLRVEFEERLQKEGVKTNQLHEQMQEQIQAQAHMQAKMARMMTAFVRHSDTNPPSS